MGAARPTAAAPEQISLYGIRIDLWTENRQIEIYGQNIDKQKFCRIDK